MRSVAALSFDDINGNLVRDPGERWFIGGGGHKDPPLSTHQILFSENFAHEHFINPNPGLDEESKV